MDDVVPGVDKCPPVDGADDPGPNDKHSHATDLSARRTLVYSSPGRRGGSS
jgi:hypothetical protein